MTASYLVGHDEMLRGEMERLPALNDQVRAAQVGSTICDATALCYDAAAGLG